MTVHGNGTNPEHPMAYPTPGVCKAHNHPDPVGAPPEAPLHRSDTPELSEEAQEAFFDAMQSGWKAAADHLGVHRVHLDVAGTRVELAFAGDALRTPFLPALQHLVIDTDGQPDLVLRLWDSRSSGVMVPPPPCARDCFTERGDIWGMSSTRVRSAFHWHEFSVNVLHGERREGVYWVRDAAELPYWSKASPLRTLLHWWAEANGAQLLHAAAVGTGDGALLITGRGGVGKSSTSLACLSAGMQFVADDYLLVALDPEPRAYSLYSTAKVDGGQLERFPSLRANVVNETDLHADKAVLHLVPGRSSQVARWLPIRAVATPEFGSAAETTVAPVSMTALQRAASFTTMSQLPGAGRRTHQFIERMIATLPGVTLRLGHDRDRVPDAISRVLAMSDIELRALGAPAVNTAPRPVVSVVIPVFNGARFIERCVRSVLGQDYAPMELIVVDDGSDDDLETVVRALPVDVRFFRQANAGPAMARNRGIREASGDVIAFLDVDDLWPEHNLAHLVACLMNDPTIDVVHGRAQVTRLTDDDDGPGEFLGNPGESYPFYIGAGLYRRGAFDRVGPFDAELRYSEDTDWFRRASECGLNVQRLEEVSLYVRRHDDNMTRGKSHVELNALRLLKKRLDRKRAEGVGVTPSRG